MPRREGVGSGCLAGRGACQRLHCKLAITDATAAVVVAPPLSSAEVTANLWRKWLWAGSSTANWITPPKEKKKKKTAAKARGADDWKNPLGSLTHNPCSGYANWAANLRGIQARWANQLGAMGQAGRKSIRNNGSLIKSSDNRITLASVAQLNVQLRL